MLLPYYLALLFLPAAPAAPWVCYRASAKAPVYTDAPVSGGDTLCFPREEGLSGAFSKVGGAFSPPPEARKRSSVRSKRRGRVSEGATKKKRNSSVAKRRKLHRKVEKKSRRISRYSDTGDKRIE